MGTSIAATVAILCYPVVMFLILVLDEELSSRAARKLKKERKPPECPPRGAAETVARRKEIVDYTAEEQAWEEFDRAH